MKADNGSGWSGEAGRGAVTIGCVDPVWGIVDTNTIVATATVDRARVALL